MEGSADFEVNVRTLVKKVLRNPPGRYPRTANYRAVWDNVRMVAMAMERPIDLVQVPRHIDVPYAVVLDRNLPNLVK
jgi:HEPN domain-containing protein